MAPLTDQQLAILDIEARHWRHAGSKEQAIRARLDISATRYYQLLGHLVDRARRARAAAGPGEPAPSAAGGAPAGSVG